jgi:hypothetical protein
MVAVVVGDLFFLVKFAVCVVRFKEMAGDSGCPSQRFREKERCLRFGGKRREADSASGMSKITSCLGSKSGNEKEEK